MVRSFRREPDPGLGPLAATMEQHGHLSYEGSDRRSITARTVRRAELIASLADITTELDALDTSADMPDLEKKMKGPFATVASLLPVVSASSPAPDYARWRSQAGWKQCLF